MINSQVRKFKDSDEAEGMKCRLNAFILNLKINILRARFLYYAIIQS